MAATWQRILTDGVISKVPTLLGSVVITPTSATVNADVTLYDGESDDDPIILQLFSGAGVSRQFIFSPPVICRRGLYFEGGTNFSQALVQWEPQKV
jgi:hypothetical protein